jgi:predicted dehydrogenase
MNKIRIAIAGTGLIGDQHCQAFSRANNIEVKACCREFYGPESDRQRQKKNLADTAEKWNAKPYDSFDDMVASDDIDAVAILTITANHYSQILKCIQNKKHALVEKPVVITTQQLDNIEAELKNTSLVIFPAHNGIYRGALYQARQMIEAGTLGKVVYSSFISTQQLPSDRSGTWRGKTQLSGGGALMDSGHHRVYMSLYLMQMPQKLQAFTAKRILADMDDEDTAGLNLIYPDGSVGYILETWAKKMENFNGIRIIGQRANIEITDALYLDGKMVNDQVDLQESFYNQAVAFADCILNGTPPESDLNNVRQCLKIIHAAYQSSKTQKVVTIT